jgi:cytochrome c556
VRERLRKLVKQGVPYDSEEMRTAYQSFTELNEQWKAMEQAHISLRNELLMKKGGADAN